MRVLIAGVGKTGTTGIFYDLKSSFEFEHTCFEAKPIASVVEEKNLLVKSIRINDAMREAHLFDRKIVMIRHPVDRIVSFLMFAPGGPRNFSEDRNVSKYLKAVEQTRKGKMSFRSLVEEFKRISGQSPLGTNLNALIDAESRHDFFPMRYEDYVGGKLGQLSKYLGFQIVKGAAVGEHARVVRTKAAGEWRYWLSRTDVPEFNKMYQQFNQHFGYVLKESELLDGEAQKEVAEDYIIDQVNHFRDKFSLPRFGKMKFSGGKHFDAAVRSLRRGLLMDARNSLEKALAEDSSPIGYHRLLEDVEHRLKVSMV